MSTVKWYRRVPVTPVANTPVIPYFTPTKKVNLGNNSLRKLRPGSNQSCGRLSAECFRKREEIKRRYHFYQRSPSTPLYKRCQVIKKRLEFDDDDCETTPETDAPSVQSKNETSSLNTLFIPTIVLTSPTSSEHCPHVKKEFIKTPYNALKKKTSTNRGIYSPRKCKLATPNTLNILKNISPVCNQKILGRGRFGWVIECQYKGERVAVKVIDMTRKKLKSSITGEQNAIGLVHPNIVRVNSITWPKDRVNGRYCIIMMECCSKAYNLQRILDNDDGMFIIPERIIRYSVDICKALHFLHSKNILHLDVKPKNILVCPNDICKLCDFGTTFKYGGNYSYESFDLFRGTTQYCSPEILQGKRPTTASDVYSFGITMWQILYRSAPYGNDIREESLIYRVVKDGLRPRVAADNTNNFVHFYSNLFINCWCEHPRERPTTSAILNRLYNIQTFLVQCSRLYMS